MPLVGLGQGRGCGGCWWARGNGVGGEQGTKARRGGFVRVLGRRAGVGTEIAQAATRGRGCELGGGMGVCVYSG